MMERQPSGEPASRFCSQCGARLPDGARFCPGCGRTLEAVAPAPARPSAHPGAPPKVAAPIPLTTPAPRSLRDQLPGLVVLTLFLAVGLGIWMRVLQPGEETPGPPTRPASQSAGELPSDHPPLTVPEEGKKFIASLAAKAAAAPNDVTAWRTLAQVQARAAEIDPTYANASIESYQHVLGIAPDDPDTLRGLGNVYYDRQQYASAAEQYAKYLEKQPDDASVRTDLGTAYLYQRQIDRAIGVYGDVLAKHPDFLQAHFNLGLAYEAKGDRAKAVASLEKARSLAADDSTRAQIERVTAQLKGEGEAHLAAPGAAGQGGAGASGSAAASGASGAGSAPPAGAPPAGSAQTGAPAAGGFQGAVEAALRAHQILGPKISRVEWADATHARVLVHDFPMQAMPESVRGLFRGRLETILDDAKTKHAVTSETGIELVDVASGTSMERVTH